MTDAERAAEYVTDRMKECALRILWAEKNGAYPGGLPNQMRRVAAVGFSYLTREDMATLHDGSDEPVWTTATT